MRLRVAEPSCDGGQRVLCPLGWVYDSHNLRRLHEVIDPAHERADVADLLVVEIAVATDGLAGGGPDALPLDLPRDSPQVERIAGISAPAKHSVCLVGTQYHHRGVALPDPQP